MLLPTFASLLRLSGSWVILFPVIEVSDSFFFSSSSGYGLRIVIQTHLKHFGCHVLIYLFWSLFLLVIVFPYFYHLNWLMIMIFLCVSSFNVFSVSVLEEDLDLFNEGNLFRSMFFLYPCLKAFQNMILMLFVFLFAKKQYRFGFYLLLDWSMEYFKTWSFVLICSICSNIKQI